MLMSHVLFLSKRFHDNNDIWVFDWGNINPKGINDQERILKTFRCFCAAFSYSSLAGNQQVRSKVERGEDLGKAHQEERGKALWGEDLAVWKYLIFLKGPSMGLRPNLKILDLHPKIWAFLHSEMCRMVCLVPFMAVLGRGPWFSASGVLLGVSWNQCWYLTCPRAAFAYAIGKSRFRSKSNIFVYYGRLWHNWNRHALFSYVNFTQQLFSCKLYFMMELWTLCRKNLNCAPCLFLS